MHCRVIEFLLEVSPVGLGCQYWVLRGVGLDASFPRFDGTIFGGHRVWSWKSIRDDSSAGIVLRLSELIEGAGVQLDSDISPIATRLVMEEGNKGTE